MKSTQAKAPQKDIDIPEKPCHVCGKKCKPFGYVLHGKAQVCSKSCDEVFHERNV